MTDTALHGKAFDSRGRVNREVRLVRHPDGALAVGDLEVVPAEMPVMAPGRVLIRNLLLSVDAATRLRLDPISPPGYLPALKVGEALAGMVVGEVVESDVEGFAPGDLVHHDLGYRDYALVDPGNQALGVAGSLAKLDSELGPPELQVGLLGMTGLTAWAGLFEVASLKPEDVVWVSAAAGAVGSVAAQLAKAHGCRVIGSAGSAEKVAYLTDTLGLDAAFNWRDGLDGPLAEFAPDGIDVYFDSVGGEHLRAALDQLRPYGRVALCGAIAGYDGQPPSAPENLFAATTKDLNLRGFLAGTFADRLPEARAHLADLWGSGRLTLDLARYEGLESAPQAVVDMLSGRTIGKCVVALG
ncbi:NADP-dependent oxidoreductase [Dietzia sp. ANT_WB102]|uniref:MDR family NADP-dependent oxidoreductase n=1 Tax=Dietzia sp. ANT_WB102 TaxID=2597345 RepID=UPI0011ED9DED|nr:NADP-dependent oxidoreductase [Dietzia sp. ANT_WB102]KAA0919296.1 NADP-dependent oxidoreductase [Dietzia sp. ANT_WB102]